MNRGISEKSWLPSASPRIMNAPRASSIPLRNALPYPLTRACTTRAPCNSAMWMESSEEPLSATTTSPVSPAEWNAASALSMQAPIDFSSLRQGITTETSAPAWEVERRETRVVDRWPGGASICETGFTGTCRAREGLFTWKAVRLPDIRSGAARLDQASIFKHLTQTVAGKGQDSRSQCATRRLIESL